jgi:hypothetical protein
MDKDNLQYDKKQYINQPRCSIDWCPLINGPAANIR